jgi:predicted protein tyrosine phosphatase
MTDHTPTSMSNSHHDRDPGLRWADLPLCGCSLRHWPEELADRHVFSRVSGTLATPAIWVSGDAPDDAEGARRFTEELVELGIRRIVDVRAEAHRGSRFDLEVLERSGVAHQHLGVVDHNDAFRDGTSVRTWVEALAAVPQEPLLVHCHMGVNRSASAAVLMLAARGFTPEQATREVLANRPSALAVYAPASFHVVSGEHAAEAARSTIRELRAGDRRLRDLQLL